MKGRTNYYALIDIRKMAEEKYGAGFAEKLTKNRCIDEFLLKLAKEKMTVCLPGDGFAGPVWSLRVSLANLDTEDYKDVGKNISLVLEEYYQEL
jgi:aspartate 4-decarboxylase